MSRWYEPVATTVENSLSLKEVSVIMETTDKYNAPGGAFMTGNTPVYIVVPDGEIWELLGINVDWEASAAAGNRLINVRIQTKAPGWKYWEIWSGPVTANIFRHVTACPGVPYIATDVSGTNTRYVAQYPLPEGIQLKPGDMILIRDYAGVANADRMLHTIIYNRKKVAF